MSTNDREARRLLERIAREIHEEPVDPSVVREAAARVWDRLVGETETAGPEETGGGLRHCSDFQALIPFHLAGRLPGAKELLFQDHVRGCVRCHRELERARSGRSAGDGDSRRRRESWWSAEMGWGLAAAAMIFVAVFGIGINTRWFGFYTGGAIRIRAVQGELFNVSDRGIVPLAVGAEIREGDRVRTAKDSDAVLTLPDGSRVEMDERAELSFSRAGIGGEGTIRLDRGNIIVEASDQGSGHLNVDAGECRVAVQGTVFAVNRGTKGSRVSVLDGEVVVRQGRAKSVLAPGEQMTSRPEVERVPLAQEIAWSRNVDRYLELLQGLTELRRDLERVPRPGLRYSSRLLDLMPPGTVIYAAVPNVSDTLVEANRVLRSRIEKNPLLRQWWRKKIGSEQADAQLDILVEKIRDLGDRLGPEIVLSFRLDGRKELRGPFLLAEVKDPEEFGDYLAGELTRWNEAAGEGGVPIRIVRGPLPAAGGNDEELLLWVHGDLLLAAPRVDDLRTLAGRSNSPGANPFLASPFHRRLADAYRDGAGWLFGADLHAILQAGTGGNEESGAERVLARMGILDARDVIVESRGTGDRRLNRVVLGFDRTRRGLASWLAEPAPMGSLAFVSPQASLVAAFVIKEPADVVEDVLGFVGSGAGTEARDTLDRFRQEYGVDLVQDFARPLGGEFAVALDGPILPHPAWKVVVEVYDTVRLQRSLEWAVKQYHRVAAENKYPDLELSRREAEGRAYYRITSSSGDLEVDYTYVDGYLVMTPGAALLNRALRSWKSGADVTTSPRFMSLLPEDGRTNFSAVVYHSLGASLGSLAQGLMGSTGKLTAEQKEAMERMASQLSASLLYAYAEPKRITFASSGGGILGGELGSLLGIGDLTSFPEQLGSMIGGASRRDPADSAEGD